MKNVIELITLLHWFYYWSGKCNECSEWDSKEICKKYKLVF